MTLHSLVKNYSSLLSNSTRITSYVIGCSLLLFSCKTKSSINSLTEIKGNWEFKQSDKTNWMPAKVPGTVHQDLLTNGIIKDPFVELNEDSIQWIEQKDWEYKTTFDVSKDQFAHENKELIFKGLDTYADVFLNDSLILTADNMFRSWEANCSKYLKEGKNSIRIIFKSPVKIGQEKLDKLGFLIPVQNEQAPKGKQNSVLTRKAAYHFGWDWGPRLVTSGIWQPILLKTWSNASIADVFLKQNKLTNELAEYTSEISVQATKDGEAEIKISVDDKSVASQKVSLKKGTNDLKLKFTINNPELWWCAGLGKQKLYQVKTSLVTNGAETDSKTTKLGVKSLKVIQKPDSAGKSFYVELNGVPVFMKGADYIPGDNLIPRVDSAKYNRVINEALDAHMNILRVWGGAVYEIDYFYDLCAEKGIILYHDFMFACSMYPGDKDFAKNVEIEAEQQVKRLRNYPNIMLWAGNNETLNGWHEWNFQQRFGYNDQQKDTLWKYYTTIFYEVLPKVVSKFDPEKLYWSCSPQSEHGKLQNPFSGDQHFWPVWFGDQPFTAYEQHPGRFISEYGFQSYPCINTLKKITTEENFQIKSKVLYKRQRSPMESLGKGCNGNDVIDRYMKREFKNPKDFESYVYVSQLLHAQAIKTAAEAHRRNRPYTMGSMYWQINDCWPTISWSTIDYYGNWKAGHYQARNSYENYLISLTPKNNNLNVFVVSDKLENKKADLILSVLDFNGKIIQNKVIPIEIIGNTSKLVLEQSISDILKSASKNEVYVKAILKTPHEIIAENNYFFVAHKDLKLPLPTVTYKITEKGTQEYSIELKTNVFAKNVYVYFDGIDTNLSSNFFDLDANSSKTVSFKIDKKVDLNSLNQKIKILTLAHTY
ncbi:MAG: glycoside hydrolase family 2 protein [Cytophagales bacterium]